MAVPVLRTPLGRWSRTTAALALAVATLAFGGGLDYHKAWDADHRDGGASKSQLLNNIRSAPEDGDGLTVVARHVPADEPLDAEALLAALAFIVLAAAKLPKGSPARRRLAEDARALRDRLEVLAPV